MTTIEFNLEWKLKLQNRFINYVKIFSTSDPESETTPSTERQWNIANYIYEELKTLGLSDVSLDENGYIYAYVPSNLENDDEPVVGFISHYDTSPDFNGENVKPQIWDDYDGKDLLLNKETGFILSPSKFESLKDNSQSCNLGNPFKKEFFFNTSLFAIIVCVLIKGLVENSSNETRPDFLFFVNVLST